MLTTHETVAPVAATELMAPALVDRIQRRAVMVAVVLGVATIIGALCRYGANGSLEAPGP